MGANAHGVSPKKKRNPVRKTAKRLAAKREMKASRTPKKPR